MNSEHKLSTKIKKRLWPLFAAKFLLCFVLWYSVEKLFMTTIGFDNASIAMMVAVYSIMSVTMEIPSGILADRWSRKGVMILAALSLALSGFFGWISHNIPIFLISAIFWGFYDAFSSGTADSMIYDTLLEEQKDTENYEHVYGSFQALGGIALVASALLGGLIGREVGLRDTFFWSIPFALLAVVLLAMFRDTNIHRQSTETKIIQHVKNTFSSVFKNPDLVWILVSLFAVSLSSGLIDEMYQVWYLALGIPITTYGLASALMLSVYGTGGAMVQYFKRKTQISAAMIAIILASGLIIFIHNPWSVIICQFLIALLAFILVLSLTAQMHRFLPSQYRAGASSATNTLGRLIFIPLVLGFGWLSQRSGVFNATWIFVILLAVGLFSEIKARTAQKSKSLAK